MGLNPVTSFLLFHNESSGFGPDFFESLAQKLSFGPDDLKPSMSDSRELRGILQALDWINDRQGSETMVLSHSQGTLIVGDALNNPKTTNPFDTLNFRFHGSAANRFYSRAAVAWAGGNYLGTFGHWADPVHTFIGQNSFNPLRGLASVSGSLLMLGDGPYSPHTLWEGPAADVWTNGTVEDRLSSYEGLL